jgi:hypothetical protein
MKYLLALRIVVWTPLVNGLYSIGPPPDFFIPTCCKFPEYSLATLNYNEI